MPVTANIYERVLRLTNSDGSGGTAFTLEIESNQYLITAGHVLLPDDPVQVELSIRGQRWGVTLNRLSGVTGGADIAVLPLETPLTPTMSLAVVTSFDGATYSQDMYFLGYPYGLALRATTGIDAYAFVKKAILSASAHTPEDAHLIYLDGFNNPGFSGGPVAFYNLNTGEPHIAGVISGYQVDLLRAVGGNQEDLDAFVRANTGIIHAYDIKHALDAIR